MTFQHEKSHLIRKSHVWERSIRRHGLLSSMEAKNMLSITLRHLYRLVGVTLHPLRRGRDLHFRISEIVRLKQQRTRTKPLQEPMRERGGDEYGNESRA